MAEYDAWDPFAKPSNDATRCYRWLFVSGAIGALASYLTMGEVNMYAVWPFTAMSQTVLVAVYSTLRRKFLSLTDAFVLIVLMFLAGFHVWLSLA